ncbi:copper resistance protein CopC [Phytomonospora sp. NPDC050363]|uniref:copper resistance CopC/CopD family protein n=1 Tax=Phytomonospora sp. NPDC050363 TaxID=3155642 RepID=UPI0033D45D52
MVSGTSRRVLFFALVTVLAGLSAALFAAPAYAHATVVSTTPQANATVDTQPVEVTVVFSEPVSPVDSQTWIVAPDGSRANSGEAVVRGSTLAYPLREGLPNGTYLVGYRVISADGHPIPGGFTFSIGQPSASPPSAASLTGPAVDGTVEILVEVNRGLAIAGLALALGPTLLLMTRWPAPRKGVLRLTATGLSTVALTAVVGLYLQAPYTTGSKLFAVSGEDVAAVVDSRYGTAMLLRLFTVLAGLPLLMLSLRRGAKKSDRWLLAVLALAMVTSWPLAGHATTSPAPPLTILTDTVHVGAGAIWLGGLVTLIAYLLRPSLADEAAEFMPHWSKWAMRLVIALAVAGVAQALIEIGEPAALFGTTYGKLVVTKAVLFALLVGAAAIARNVLRKRRADEALTGREIGLLRRSIGLEIVIAVAVICVTAVLVQTTPARVAYADEKRTEAQPFSQRLSSNYFQLQVEVTPGEVGANSVHLYAFGPDGAAIDPLEWKATVALPSANLPPVALELLELGPNHVTGEITLPSAGDWLFSFTLRVSKLDQATVTQSVPIR